MILTLVTIDQWTKYYISSNFNLYQSKPVIENFFHLTYITNDGMAFGLSFPGGKKLLLISKLFHRLNKIKAQRPKFKISASAADTYVRAAALRT